VKLAALLVLALAATAHADRLGFDPATVYKVPTGTAPSTGPANAPITIVVWSDFACGYCYRAQFTLDALERLYPGQLRFVHRTLPLDDEFTLTAEAALAAAAQGKLRPMSERIYAVGGRLDRVGVELIARELGLDMIRFRADLDTKAHRAQIDADVKDALALGINGTPAFFINGRPIHGSLPLKAFADVIDQELARSKNGAIKYDELVDHGAIGADAASPKVPPTELDAAATYRVGLGLPGHQLGPDTALVTIVVWGDFQCPFCQKVTLALRAVRAKYGDDVRIVYRHYAMRSHRRALVAAEAAIAAADQGKFWAFHDRLYDQFNTLSRPELEQHARAAGLDLAKFRVALDEHRYRDAVEAETAAANALGVDGTPTMFVNGTAVVGSRDTAALDAIVDAQLAKARTAVKGGIAARDVYALFMSGATGSDRADPSRIPTANQVTLRADDRARAAAAACRRRDPARAKQLADGLTGTSLRSAKLVCTAVAIDL
jgi:protein-disulfide isomerase